MAVYSLNLTQEAETGGSQPAMTTGQSGLHRDTLAHEKKLIKIINYQDKE